MIEEIENKFPVDSIKFSDGTRLWNLVRVFIYANIQNVSNQKKKKINLKSAFFILKEGVLPLKLPKRKINVCGFSSTESRKEYKGKFYDIYLDPLYEILGDNFTVFEWPSISGRRRKYFGKIYSKNYVKMHIPIFTKTFWNIFFYKLIGHKNFSIESEEILLEIIKYISKTSSIDEKSLKKNIYDFLTVFFYVKDLLKKILTRISPKVVLIRCGYGRFPMALSQACRELGIPSVELQHGLITPSIPPYVKKVKSGNKDCTPEYLLTHGDVFRDIVKNGNIFEKDKVFSTGHIYLEKIKEENKKETATTKSTISDFKHNLLFTSQWILSEEIKEFIIRVADKMKKSNLNLGIIFKPHPYDKIDYSGLDAHENIILADKYEDTFKLLKLVDAHSTVYSTSGLEAMAFGKPNIFVDIAGLTKKSNPKFIVKSPEKFIETLQYIIYNAEISKQTLELANMFFKSEPKKNFKEFFKKIGAI